MRRELIGRLKALEETHSKVSPSVIQRAFQRLSESGQWPKDPAAGTIFGTTVARLRRKISRSSSSLLCNISAIASSRNATPDANSPFIASRERFKVCRAP